MSETLDMLRSLFPGKVMLTVEDVAQVMGLEKGRAGREAISAALRRGDVLPGLRKVLGRWLVPITALANWLDSLSQQREVVPPPTSAARRGSSVDRGGRPTGRPRGRVPDKVRVAQKARALQFFGEVAATFDRSALGDVLPQGRKRIPTPL